MFMGKSEGLVLDIIIGIIGAVFGGWIMSFFGAGGVTVPVKANSVPGLVLVNYRVAAADGHVLDGEYTFSFQRSGGTTSANPTASTSHHGNKNTAVYSATTVLIVSALLAGVWIYRRRKP